MRRTSHILEYRKLFSAEDLLAVEHGPEWLIDLALRQLGAQIMASPKRPDIKPGRHYAMTLTFHEVVLDEEPKP